MEALNKALNKVPIIIFIIAYCGWLSYDYYDWLNSPTSELGQKKTAIQNAKKTLDASKKKLAEADEFFKNLEVLRTRIRQLDSQLAASKNTLNNDVDIANFVRMVTLEAKKLGLVIKGIKPDGEVKKEYYVEVPFTVQFRGAYVQALVFFDRIAKISQVVTVSEFAMKPSGNAFTKYVELEGNAKIVAYRYLGTHADEVSKNSDQEKAK
jgi:type IV pilus assembly protein PilO